MYAELKLEHIERTVGTLRRRIDERFPGSGLGRVAAELERVTVETGPMLERIRKPHHGLRAAIVMSVLFIALLIGAFAASVGTRGFDDGGGVGGMMQALESTVQNIIFLGIAIYSLVTLETRLDRKVSLRELHRLRSIVHIIDMHQLTKDPEHLLSPGNTTASSPERRLSQFELARYLDYCTELLSLSSKVAALHVQYVNDPVVLNAVNDIEVLASNLSSKIWQKLMILDTVRASAVME